MPVALLQNLRFSFRQILKRPGFSLTVVLVLALGLGANTAIFSIVYSFLLRPLPYPASDRLMGLFERDPLGPPGSDPYNSVSPGHFLDWRRLSKSFTAIAAAGDDAVNLASPQNLFEPQRAYVCLCSQSIFKTLEIYPILGRAFRPDEDRIGAAKVAIISYRLWQRRFGGTRDVVHRQIRINGENHEIIGVMPRGFGFPYRTVDIWLPLLATISPELQQSHDNHFLLVVGRLRPGVSMEQARAEIDGMVARYAQAHPQEVSGKGGNVVSLQRYLVQDVQTSLFVLLGAVACVLIIACVNVANLLLSRAAARTREIAIREAIGASTNQIVAQLLTESVLLALLGGLCGLLLASFLANALIAQAPNADAVLPPGSLPFSPAVFAFTFVMASLAGVATGLYPALQSTRTDLVNSLKETTRSATGTRSHGRFRNILVAAEVALSVLLLIAAGLLGRSFLRLYSVQPGVRIDHTMMIGLSVADGGTSAVSKIAETIRQILEGARQVPGVLSVGATTCPPLLGHCSDYVFRIEGRPLPPGQFMDALTRSVDPDFFKAAGVPLLRGRTFTARDGIGFDDNHPRQGAIVISQSLAREYFPGQDPIGHFITVGNDYERAAVKRIPIPRHQVVGIVGDVLQRLDARIQPTMYMPLFDGRYADIFLVLHTSAEPHAVIGPVRRQIHELRPDLPLYDVRTMEEALGYSASDRRFNLLLIAAFAAMAMMLTAIGLYGVLSYNVAQRTSEIGIRLALGADSSAVRALILKQGMRPAAIGILAGLCCAAALVRLMQSLLFQVQPFDPVTFICIPIFLVFIAMLACYLPAVRATRIDPTIALRAE